jgi:uncharacterized protein (DUF697 family)/uncharacterized tellurite resistance protein B-like protein
MMNEEVFAGIKVLVALAQADGTVHDDERIAIENALDGEELPEGTNVARLLTSTIDLPAALSKIASEEARKRTYTAACALVYVDGHLSAEEAAMLARIEAGLHVDAARGAADAYKQFSSVTPGSKLTKVDDAAARQLAVAEEITNAATFSAVLASTSLPVAAESCLFTNNVRLARNVGLLYGAAADDAFWRTFVGNAIGAAASWFAVSSLLKLLPGGGKASFAAYASTFALGRVTALYFEKNEAIEPSELRDAFAAAKKEGLTTAHAASAAITARREQLGEPKAKLDADLAAAKVTDLAYADALVALA